MRRLYNPIDRHLFEGFHLRRLVLTNDQLSDAEFLARGDHDEIVLDNNEQLWSGSAASTSDRKRTRRLSLRNTSIDSLSQRGVDISQFADVEELILAGNELRAVSAAELGPFERLRVLDLSDNSVDQFAGNFSSVLPRLDTLNLTDNRLETLPESTWRLLLPSFPDFPAFPCLFSPCPLFSPPMFSHFLQFFPTRVDVAPAGRAAQVVRSAQRQSTPLHSACSKSVHYSQRVGRRFAGSGAQCGRNETPRVC